MQRTCPQRIDFRLSMRIISGTYKGRRLYGPRGMDLRPTSDRLKETLFNILSPIVRGSVALDVFAGTGAIGLEALSRGAREVVFVEEDRQGCTLIRRNLELCGISKGFRLIQRDAFTALRQLSREGFAADILFLDPPYEWQPYADLIDTIARLGLARAEAPVIFEHRRSAGPPEAGPGYRRTRIVRQGDHSLSFYICDCGLRIDNPFL